jgi:peptidyl-prolyl cis-trans isomerase C
VDDRIVVRVAEHAVTIHQFEQLAAILAAEIPVPRDTVALRHEVLDVIVARELLLLEGEARGLAEEPEIAARLAQRERELVEATMVQREVDSYLKFSEEELSDLYREWGSGEDVRAGHILSATDDEAEEVMAELQTGAVFEELARRRSRHVQSAHAGGDMGYMRREDLLPELRDVVWTAMPGEVLPQPVRTRMGVHVVRVIDHRRRSLAEMRPVLEREVGRRRRETRRRELGQILRARHGFRWQGEVAAALVAGEISKDRASAAVIAAWDGGVLSAAEYTRRIRRVGVRETEIDTARARQLGDKVTISDLLWVEGRARGYQRLADVVSEVRAHKVELFADRVFALVAAGVDVGEQALKRSYEDRPDEYRRHPEIYIQEILVDDRGLADSLATLVRAGEDMDSLAARYSQRVWAREKGGRFGPLTERSAGYRAILKVARHAQVGTLQGPIVTPGGIALFRVTRREGGAVSTFEEAREAVRQDVLGRAMDALIDSLRLIRKAQIKVDEEALGLTLGGTAGERQ